MIVLPESFIKQFWDSIFIDILIDSPAAFFPFLILSLILGGDTPSMIEIFLEVALIQNIAIEIIFNPKSWSIAIHELALEYFDIFFVEELSESCELERFIHVDGSFEFELLSFLFNFSLLWTQFLGGFSLQEMFEDPQHRFVFNWELTNSYFVGFGRWYLLLTH